ncbi:DM13 domain-containing protein [Paenarthrobacter sp. JL.01a]|uniref:DM13 domain-containing protein n=1 Tax=Paenarthrobacter sp. JL.01a TaxID=2979324 RepID=UPI0021CA9EA6|nr:DM13 domain-containing protein [Paenarthrobacter sp. JL.01a]UXM90199.1 DM13 domain-containing protein [Paenarthrobacter sp. JL.01a]
MNGFRSSIRSHKALASAAGVVVLVFLVLGAFLFQPWRLFTSSSLDEALPVATTFGVTTPEDASPDSTRPDSGPATVAGPIVVRTGMFGSQEHQTTGTAQLLKLPDGSHVLRLEDLASSDGPDVKVWLSSLEAGGDWYKYRSGRYVDLGAVKATHGNQNYAIPAGTDLSGVASVVLWCDRFSVAFGSAPLA